MDKHSLLKHWQLCFILHCCPATLKLRGQVWAACRQLRRKIVMPLRNMEYTGNIGEQIISNFFDESFSDILCFPNPKTKNNAQVSDILLWLNQLYF